MWRDSPGRLDGGGGGIVSLQSAVCQVRLVASSQECQKKTQNASFTYVLASNSLLTKLESSFAELTVYMDKTITKR